MQPKTYILVFKNVRQPNRTIQALNLGEAIHKARKMSERQSIPNKFLVLPASK